MQAGFATRRLRMRRLARADEAFYCRIYTDAGLMRHVAQPSTEQVARKDFHTAYREGSGTAQWWYWVMQARDGGDDVGLLGLVASEDAAGHAGEIGAMLLADAQGAGLAAEAIAALVDIAFAQTALQCLHTRHARANTAADGLMRKLGFIRRPAGDQVCWQLSRDAWQAAAACNAGRFANAGAGR